MVAMVVVALVGRGGFANDAVHAPADGCSMPRRFKMQVNAGCILLVSWFSARKNRK